jgi:rubredoxin
MRCPECDVAHSDWTDRGTCANNDGRTTLDLWECERCGYTLEGVRL